MCDEVAPAFARGARDDLEGVAREPDARTPTEASTRGRIARRWRSSRKSDLFKAVATNPNFADITSIDFDVLEGPTSVTRGFRGGAGLTIA